MDVSGSRTRQEQKQDENWKKIIKQHTVNL